MLVTLSGIVILVKPVQYANASLPISVEVFPEVVNLEKQNGSKPSLTVLCMPEKSL